MFALDGALEMQGVPAAHHGSNRPKMGSNLNATLKPTILEAKENAKKNMT